MRRRNAAIFGDEAMDPRDKPADDESGRGER
jgi:hypothetical protein